MFNASSMGSKIQGVTMFEKEAEEIMRQNGCRTHSGNFIQADKVCELIQKGAELGYNKANEWHYVKDVKPKDNEYVLIYTDLKNTYVARIPTEKDYFITRRGGFVQMSAVIAWKEIVLPELKESE